MTYDRLPLKVRVRIAPVLEPAYFTLKRIFSIASQFRLSVYQFQGERRWGNGTLVTLLFGEGRGMLPYILNLLYSEEPTRKRLGNAFIFKIKSLIESDDHAVDLVLIATDQIFSRFLPRLGFIVIPEWITFKLDLQKPLLTSNRHCSLYSNIKKIHKHKYRFEMTKDPERFRYFYQQMYLPYKGKKYGETPSAGVLRNLERIFERGGLLLVKRDNEYIAGFLVQMDDKKIYARASGVKDGNIKYVNEGAVAAGYYFIVLWAKNNGYKCVDFGHCRPFINDGLFFHKKTWGMTIEKSNRIDFAARAVFGIRACHHQQVLLDFLAKNPLIVIDRGRLKGLHIIQQEHALAPGEVQSFLRTHYVPGMDGFVMASSHGFTKEAEEFASSQAPQELYLKVLGPDNSCGSISSALLLRNGVNDL